jgi:hypothetical protein
MNFLLATLIIILLLFPGFLFRAQYLNVSHGRTFRSTLIEELLFSIIPCIIIHLPLIHLAFCYSLSAEGFYLLMINNPEAINYIDQEAFLGLLYYFLGSFFLALLLGSSFRYISELFNWEINVPMLRIRNEWYYKLTGTFLINSKSKRRRYAPARQVNVDVVVELNKDAYIYRGTLEYFVLSKEDGIDRLFLKNAKRRKLSFDASEKKAQGENVKGEEEKILKIFEQAISLDDDDKFDLIEKFDKNEYYNIPGDEIIIPYREIKNLNLTYVFVEEDI